MNQNNATVTKIAAAAIVATNTTTNDNRDDSSDDRNSLNNDSDKRSNESMYKVQDDNKQLQIAQSKEINSKTNDKQMLITLCLSLKNDETGKPLIMHDADSWLSQKMTVKKPTKKFDP